MAICNDRRWPETYRVMGLQGAELIALGYNTPTGLGEPYQAAALADFHNALSLRAGAYQKRLLGGRGCEVWHRGRLRPDRAKHDRRTERSERCNGGQPGRPGDQRWLRHGHRRPEAYGPITGRGGSGAMVQPDREQAGLEDKDEKK